MTDRSVRADAQEHDRRSNLQVDDARLAEIRAGYVGGVVQLYSRTEIGWLLARVDQLTAERDQFAAGVPLVCSDERHDAKVRGLEAELRRLAGERDGSDELARRAMEQRRDMAEERFIWQERGDRAERFNRQYAHVLDDLRAYADKAIASGQPIGPAELRGLLGESVTDDNAKETDHA